MLNIDAKQSVFQELTSTKINLLKAANGVKAKFAFFLAAFLLRSDILV